ncbi:hypothetical protein ACS0TY_030582 [Phlomoides rotata]
MLKKVRYEELLSLIMEESASDHLPPGFRFHPTDEELITYYLTNKVCEFDFTTKAVAEVDLNKSEPWDLPGKASMGEKEWYFFSLRDRKYPTGLRTNRATEAGYWKTTGKDKEIFRGSSNELVGMKKTLVFYRGRAPKGEKTNWVMHEYRLQNNHPPTKEEWVVCRVFQKSMTMKRPQQTTSSPTDHESPTPTCDTIMDLPNFGSTGLQNYNSNSDSDQYHNMMMMMMMMNNTSSSSLANWPNLQQLPSNLSINSLLLTALHLRGTNHNYPFTPHANYNMINPNPNPNPNPDNELYIGNDPTSADFSMLQQPSTSIPPPQPLYKDDW